MSTPSGLAFFQERSNAFAEIIGLPNAGILFDRVLELFVEFFRNESVHQLFCEPQRCWTIFAELRGKFASARLQLVGRDNFIYQSQPVSLGCVEDSAGE